MRSEVLFIPVTGVYTYVYVFMSNAQWEVENGKGSKRSCEERPETAKEQGALPHAAWTDVGTSSVMLF